ncbi:hypothetical protein Tco_0192339, partial [Tanacetum coccineum]
MNHIIGGKFKLGGRLVVDLLVNFIKVPRIAASLIVAKLGAGGHNYLFDWLSRQLVGLADFLDGIPLLRSVYVAMMVSN